ncbi:MAG: hypothetical protein AAGJ18_19760 [Bacteroidota bacterium]
MKNLIIKTVFCLFALSICSFQLPETAFSNILQTALDIDNIKVHLAKNEDGKIAPLTLITNGLAPTNLAIEIDNQPVTVQATVNQAIAGNASVLELTELKVKERKSILTFKYGKKTMKIRLKKEQHYWIPKIATIKYKNTFETTTVTSSEIHF